MESLFKNTTVLDLDRQCGFEEFRYGLSKPKRCIIFLIVALLLFFRIKDDFVEDVMLSSFFYGFALLSVILFMWLFRKFYKFSYRRNLNRDKRFQNPVEAEYAFSEDAFQYVIGTNSGSLEYKLLYKVYESNDFFYLFLSPMEAYIVSKDGFTSGTAGEFTGFMTGKMGKKFYNKATKKKRN